MTALTSDNHTYDQIVIGAGSAAAMYLNTLRNYYRTAPETETMPSSILVIGMEDPWAGARGYAKDRYIQNINQARQLFEHGTGKTASMDIDPVDRTEWAETNKDLIEQVTLGHVLTAEVAMVKERAGLRPRVFLVETKGSGSYAANKIVIAAGAGIETTENEYHHVPDEVLTYRQQSSNPKPTVMDLDQFQRGEVAASLAPGPTTKVGIIGPNAGTDAIMEASTRGYKTENVFWFMPPGQRPGTALTWDISSLSNASFDAATAGKEKGTSGNEGCVVRHNGNLALSNSGSQINVSYDGKSQLVDFFVYSMGQRGGGIKRATSARDSKGRIESLPFVDSSIASELEPIYDVNQRFSNLEHAGNKEGGAWEHVLGIQLQGTNCEEGVMVVGSAAVIAGRDVSHNYLDAEYAQFRTKLGTITADFINVARDKFPELCRFNTFSSMISASKIQDLNTGTIQWKTESYVDALAIKASYSAHGLTGAGPKEITARREARVKHYRALAKEWCYLFELRVKAAKYYGKLQKNDKPPLGGRKRNPQRPDSLQSAGLRRTLPQTVSDGRLLGGMQRNIAGANQSHNVDHILNFKGNNFLEDQQTLALYIAAHYTNIDEQEANRMVKSILNDRQSKGRGFTPEEMGVWDYKLAEAERNAKAKSTQTRGFAYNSYYNNGV